MNPREQVASTIACDLAGDIVRRFGNIRLRVFGASMVPSILPGDLISVQRAALSEIFSGDIVLFERAGRMFAHRVVGFTGSPEHSVLITRGDWLRHNDPPISSGELLGKVTSIERGGRQTKISSKPGGFTWPLTRLLQTSDRATYFCVKLVSLYGKLAARTFSRRRKNGSTGAIDEDHNLAGAATRKLHESPDGTFDAPLRPLNPEGAVKCQA